MGGSGGGGEENFKSAGFDPQDIAGFASSSLGAKYNSDQIKALSGLQTDGQGKYGTPSYDPNAQSGTSGSSHWYLDQTNNDIAQSFTQWKKDQSNSQAAWANYAALVNAQGGGQGQQTIIGAPYTAPQVGLPTPKVAMK